MEAATNLPSPLQQLFFKHRELCGKWIFSLYLLPPQVHSTQQQWQVGNWKPYSYCQPHDIKFPQHREVQMISANVCWLPKSFQGLPRWPSGIQFACQCRSHPLGEGNGNPLQYPCLGNPVDRGTWQATVHGVTKQLDTTAFKQQSHSKKLFPRILREIRIATR